MFKKSILWIAMVFGLVFMVDIGIMPVEAASQQDISYASNLIQGTWQASDGGKVAITSRYFGKGSYEIRDVSNNGTYTVVTIAVNGGQSIDTLTFQNENYNDMMLNNLTTGYSQDYSRL